MNINVSNRFHFLPVHFLKTIPKCWILILFYKYAIVEIVSVYSRIYIRLSICFSFKRHTAHFKNSPEHVLNTFPMKTHSSRILPPKRRRTGAPGEKEGPQAELLPPLLGSLICSCPDVVSFISFDKVPLRQRLIINVERGQRALCHFSRKYPGEGTDPSTRSHTLISHCLSHQSIDLVWAFRCCCVWMYLFSPLFL